MLTSRTISGLVALDDFDRFPDLNALVVEDRPIFGFTFLGTCFAYMSERVFLTAAHCVRGASKQQIGVFRSGDGRFSITAADDVVCHPRADLAIVHLAKVAPARLGGIDFTDTEVSPFRGNLAPVEPGTDFVAYGFPEDVFNQSKSRHRTQNVVARVFKGHFQRFLKHRSYLGYEYEAGELSVPCPAGLSGGPLYPVNQRGLLFGMVTENLESYTTVQEIETTEADGRINRVEHRRVINYGIALMLRDVHGWIHEQLEARRWWIRPT